MKEEIINSEISLEAYKKFLDTQFEQHHYLRVSLKTGKTRTNTQSRALHLFCSQLAEALNEAGYDFRTFVRQGYPVPFNERLVKDFIWRPIQQAITGKESTTKPTRQEYVEIYDSLNVKMAEYGIYVPFPSRDN